MYYDLHVPYTANHAELQRRLAFLAELVLDVTITGKLPGEIVNQIPSPLPFTIPYGLHIFRRCTLHLSDPTQNHRLSSLAPVYDILALRPINEKCLQQACQNLDCDLISLDLSQRFPFYFKHNTLSSALQRGIKVEICYGPGILNADGGASRRNLISNATQLIRATRGRGLVISSEAKSLLACRAPADVINMAVLWGLGQEKGKEAIARGARSVIVQADMKRKSFRGVIDIVYGGERLDSSAGHEKLKEEKRSNAKRKANVVETDVVEDSLASKPISKREQKRQAKKARFEQAKGEGIKKGFKGATPPSKDSLSTPQVDKDGD